MTDFVETMKLVERAQEDIYFARIDRELIAELHRKAAIEKRRRRVLSWQEKPHPQARSEQTSGNQ
jgi:hypothetical protein